MIDFMKWRFLYFALSLLVIIPGLISLLMFGLKPSIDFTGGALLEIQLPTADMSTVTSESLNQFFDGLYEIESLQTSGDHQILIKGKEMNNDLKGLFLNGLQTKYGEVSEVRFETVGPALGSELVAKMLTAILIVAFIVTMYVWKQFDELRYGISAILAMFHDSLVILGVFSILGKVWGVEVDVLFVTALLTTLSFSVHDTIVVYDRIRELRRNHPNYSLRTLINTAVLETLGRSLNNSITIIIMLVTLVVLGGESIKWFAVALLVGAITGTYSSTFTAAPLLLLWEDVARSIQQRRRFTPKRK